MRKIIVALLIVFAFVSANRGLEPQVAKREAQVAALTRIVTNPVVAAPTLIPQHAINKPVVQPTQEPLETSAIVERAPPRILPVFDRVVAVDLNMPKAKVTGKSRSDHPVAKPNSPAEPLIAAQLIRPASAPTPTAWRTSVEGTVVPARALEAPKQSKPVTGKARVKLVRAVQRFLKSKGCYRGRIDGIWGNGSKRGMATFLQRANAKLAVNQPDYAMLSMVKSRQGISCDGGCPQGQSLSRSGACVPNAVLARTQQEAAPVRSLSHVLASDATMSGSTSASHSHYPRQQRAQFPGRMSVGGPSSGDVSVAAVYQDAQTGGPESAAGAQVLAPDQYQLEPQAAPKPRASKKRVKKKRVRSSRSYRSKRKLMKLFENPLGRM